MECRDTQISCIVAESLVEPLEACRPQDCLKNTPKHPEVHGRAIRCAPHREAFIPNVKSKVSRTGWQSYKSTPTSEGMHPGAQLGWHGRRHTKVLQDLGIKAR
jgi:hypothetical protein